MSTPLLPTAYLPSVRWCAAAWPAATVAVEACEHYQKGSLRNRCLIAGPNGVQRLSIPLRKGKHEQMPIRAVQIAYDEPWQRQHWRSICTAYGNAPFFEHYADELRPFFEQRYEFLFDYNWAWLEYFFLKKWGWTGRFEPTDDFFPLGEWTRGADFRIKFSGGKISAEEVGALAVYPQVFAERQGFLPDLSALDLLLCCGKQAPAYLARPQAGANALLLPPFPT